MKSEQKYSNYEYLTYEHGSTPPRYCNAGKFTSRSEWIHPLYNNETTELMFVTEGEFLLEENGNEYKLSSGDIIYLDAGKTHKGVKITDSKVSFYWIHFYLPNGEVMPIKHLTLREVYPVSLLCRQILHYAESKASPKVLDSLLCVLIEEIDSQDIKKESLGSLAERIVEWLRINSDRQLKTSDISERFGYNEDYISRLLKHEYGRTLKQMIVDKRMEYIKYLLSETELTLTDISFRSGFTDVKLFLKFFAYHEGITPTEYRATYKSGHTNNR